MITLYIYHDRAGVRVDHHSADTLQACEDWASEWYGDGGYHWSTEYHNQLASVANQTL